ncbi:hypothetical protein H1D32_12915 [Anaerobacillus sp. CMMVII]|uniref:hypothetical protein n=1 Tax=Anaerobacillus sp. CMMVII TaxID=2755588 RepID=UPI0021B74B6C|nr:hypothetical protein [Anaerobacillus sp. CMMVII]MCT8138563.1 hypothetical protein [Anaerobacillus sp. CMMVII]
MKDKNFYIGIGLLIGVGIGFLSFSNIKITNIGHLDKLTIIQSGDRGDKGKNTKQYI